MSDIVYPCSTHLPKFSKDFFSDKKYPPEDLKAIKKFIKFQESRGITPRRIIKYIATFKMLYNIHPKFNLMEADEKKFMDLSKKILDSKYKRSTQAGVYIVIRKLFKVIEGRNLRYPEKLDFFKPPQIPKTTKSPSDVLTEEEFQRIREVTAKNLRDLALIYILKEGGLRVGEIVNLDIKDVNIVVDGVEIHIPDKPGCKSGSRDIWLIETLNPLRSWIQNHPQKDDPNAPLFTSISYEGAVQRMNGYSIRMMLHRVAMKSNISKKKMHPHNFRHTCGTEKAILGFSESQLNQFMGWTQGSNMAQTYIHMSKKGVKEAYKRALGMRIDGEETKPKECPICHFMNPWRSRECGNCQQNLDLKERQNIYSEVLTIRKLLESHKDLLKTISDLEKEKNIKG